MYRIKIIIKNCFNFFWAYLLIGFLTILRHLPTNIGFSFFSWLAKTFGPLVPRHKIALANLKAAYPEKTEQELCIIAIEMWENMGRLLAEYVFLDKIFDFDPNTDKLGLVEVNGIEIFQRLKNEKKPHIFSQPILEILSSFLYAPKVLILMLQYYLDHLTILILQNKFLKLAELLWDILYHPKPVQFGH
ncbi:lipid A biosynthesis acyltransferase [Bartonella sp. JB15]|nr:lipid A biosynthesis acyltransferase [Bartonella sp. JB15]